MAYDKDLANRLREQLAGEKTVEKAMFGGLAFLINGNMAISASGNGGLLVRSDPNDPTGLHNEVGVEAAIMRGRVMSGWLRVSDDAVESDEALARWVAIGTAYAKSLPPK